MSEIDVEKLLEELRTEEASGGLHKELDKNCKHIFTRLDLFGGYSHGGPIGNFAARCAMCGGRRYFTHQEWDELPNVLDKELGKDCNHVFKFLSWDGRDKKEMIKINGRCLSVVCVKCMGGRCLTPSEWDALPDINKLI